MLVQFAPALIYFSNKKHVCKIDALKLVCFGFRGFAWNNFRGLSEHEVFCDE